MKIVFNLLAGEKPAARYGIGDTPAGRCLIADTNRGVCWLSFHSTAKEEEEGIAELTAFWGDDKLTLDIDHAKSLIGRIFSQKRSGNESVSVLVSGTPFQLAQWRTLTELKHGETISYGELAARSGSPRAVRAAGTAIGRNNVSFLIPCHRVVRSDGSVGHYRWGSKIKEKLLAWEKG